MWLKVPRRLIVEKYNNFRDLNFDLKIIFVTPAYGISFILIGVGSKKFER